MPSHSLLLCIYNIISGEKKKKKEVDLSLNTLVWTFIKISYHHFEMVGKELMFKNIGIITYLFPFASYSVKCVAVRKYM